MPCPFWTCWPTEYRLSSLSYEGGRMTLNVQIALVP